MKDGVPPEVFTKVHANPVNKTPDDMRSNLRQAVMLLKEAGWEIKDGGLTNVQTGQKMQVEFLLGSVTDVAMVRRAVADRERDGLQLRMHAQLRQDVPEHCGVAGDHRHAEVIL